MRNVTRSRAESAAEGQSCTHGYLDEPFAGFGENAGREMLKKSRITSEDPRQREAEAQS